MLGVGGRSMSFGLAHHLALHDALSANHLRDDKYDHGPKESLRQPIDTLWNIRPPRAEVTISVRFNIFASLI